MRDCFIKVTLFVCVLLLTACGGDSSEPTDPPDTRGFYMGFTPWPYDSTVNAVNVTYQTIQQDGDLIHHQLMQGIPWDEAYNSLAYPAGVESEINLRLDQTIDGQTVLLSLDSLNSARNGLANNWADGGEEARSAPWDSREFDSPEVITAYTNFALDLIGRFNPEYFNFGTEASELILNKPAQYTKFVTFAQQVSAAIKTQYPNLKLMISVALKHPTSTDMDNIKANIADVLPYIDVLGVSVYPYIFFNHADKGNPDNLPTDWLTQVQTFAGGKPIAITETGWIAEDLVINTYSVNVPSNETYQSKYVTRLLKESDQLSVKFVVWWSLIDFQAFWEGDLLQDDLAAIWRDIGLYDETVQPRSGLANWKLYLDKPKI